MNSEEKKKAIEAHAFDELARLRQLKVTKWTHGIPPEPDIVAIIDGRSIGIEITGLVCEHTSSTKGRNQTFVAMVADQCSKLGLPPLDLRLYGLEIGSLDRTQRVNLATELSRFVAERYSPNDELCVFEGENLPDSIANAVSSIGVFRQAFHTEVSGLAPAARWIGQFQKSDIESAILRKQGKRKKYHGKYDEAWLLITSQDFTSWGEISESVVNAGYQSDFDRVLFWATVSKEKIWEILLKKK